MARSYRQRRQTHWENVSSLPSGWCSSNPLSALVLARLDIKGAATVCIYVFTCRMCFQAGCGVWVVAVECWDKRARSCFCHAALPMRRTVLHSVLFFGPQKDDTERACFLSLPQSKVTAWLSLATRLNFFVFARGEALLWGSWVGREVGPCTSLPLK